MSRVWQFRFVVVRPPADEQVDRLIGRAVDACVEVHPAGGAVWVAFDRDAPTLVDAVVSGVRDLDVAGIVPLVLEDDDDIVSLDVVAERIGRVPAAVRRWAADASGFPGPVVRHPRRPCYRWSEVMPWLRAEQGFVPPETSADLAAVNHALGLRLLGPHVERMAAVRSLICRSWL